MGDPILSPLRLNPWFVSVDRRVDSDLGGRSPSTSMESASSSAGATAGPRRCHVSAARGQMILRALSPRRILDRISS